MCGSIKQLYKPEQPATEEEIRAASLQFVRKITGIRAPSKSSKTVYDEAVESLALVAKELLANLASVKNS